MFAILCELALAQEGLAVGVNDNAADFGVAADDIRRIVESEVSGELALDDQESFLRAMAGAGALAGAGQGVAYGSQPKVIVVGASFGSAVDRGADAVDGESLPSFGVATQAGLMVGVPLRAFVPEDSIAARFELYLGGMANRTPNVASFVTRSASFGAHVQISLVEPAGTPQLGWGGVDVTTGVAWSRFSMGLNEQLALQAEINPVRVVWRTSGAFDVSARSVSVPLELTTSTNLAFLGIFAGGALDFRSAVATSDASLTGNLVAVADGQGETHIGEAALNLGARAVAPPVTPRLLVGLEIIAGPVRLYGQGNLRVGNGLGAHGGLRFVL